MAAATSVEVSNDVHDHGTLVNAARNRVQCRYCPKEVTGFSHLKYHLGQLSGDVKPCEDVPENVKILMRSRQFSWKEDKCPPQRSYTVIPLRPTTVEEKFEFVL
ncbi:Zinc finger protein [Thalictrum thalictroides]|uniref:Zinc finger protein n=1 Tax=Thalictrum thalictroides TaxID=46969 RepID=A0A7J6UZR2_THATH|nr:Zinc finger protein [Thalictrum thalictroides]